MTLGTSFPQRLAAGRLGRSAERLMTRIDDAGTFGVLGKEIFGINSPRLINVRGWDEKMDVARLELGNSIGSFGGGALVNWLTDKCFSAATKAKDAWVFGKSVFLNANMFAYLFAMPYFRNYYTAKEKGTTRFADVIGSNDGTGPQSAADFKRSEQRYLKIAQGTLLTGAVVGLAGLIRGTLRAKKGLPFATGKLAELWKNTFNYKDGHFKNMTAASAVVFWGASTYTGWISSARDKYERVEASIKFANFFLMFYLLEVGIQRMLGTAKTYNQDIIDYMRKHFASKGRLSKIDFSKENMVKTFNALGYDSAKQAKFLKVWGVHRALGYLSSVVGLFISNWAANSISMAATKHRVSQQREAHGLKLMNNFVQTGWKSPLLGG